MTPEQTRHIGELLEHYCTQINSYSYSVNNRRTVQAMTEILHRMWQEMLTLGLFSNFEEFTEDPIIVSSYGEISSYTFIFRECPFWYDGGKEWMVRV